MSKFFRAKGDSDSETESSDEEVEDQKAKKTNFRWVFTVVNANHQLIFSSDDLDFMAGPEDDEKRVVRAQKDKKFDELKGIIKQNRDAKSNKDLNKLLTGFDTLTKAYEKSRTIFQRQNVTTPRFYIRWEYQTILAEYQSIIFRSLVEIEDYANKLWEDKELKSSLSKNNAKALPALRQKVKKYIKEQSLAELVSDYRATPDEDGYETPEDEEDDDLEIVPDVKAEKSPGKPAEKALDSDSDSDSDDDDSSSWSSEPDTSGSDSDEDSVTKMEQLRRYFLKKEFREESKDDKKDKRKRVIKVKEVVEQDDDDDWTPVNREKSVVHFDPKEEVTHDVLIKKLNEVMAGRGKRTTDRNQHVANLQKLLEVSEEKKLGLGISVKINFCIISALFELNAKISDYMEYETFMNTLQTVSKLLDVLIETDRVKLSVTYAEEDENLKVCLN